jgi:NAD(P)-dependent dehydrogenase (short-subunit alcohol dehydrogenase family)
MTRKFNLAGLATILLLAVAYTGTAQSAEGGSGDQKAVLVTGASTGIGRMIAEALAAEGYFVYAGARKQRDLDALNQIENIQAIRLDVTKQDEIDAAVQTVRDGGRGLYGLVNNAGVNGAGGPQAEIDIDDAKWVFDVNVFGVQRVTAAFAPLIVEEKGRITTISSIGGIVSGAYWGTYSMSKHAIEAYVDALAEEMAQFDVQVSVIEPGRYNSEFSKNAVARYGELTEAQKASPYAEYYINRSQSTGDRSAYKNPDAVADATLHALFNDNPKRRYMVVPNAEEAGWTVGSAMQELVQLNEGQDYSFSREELIAMLDKAMSPEEK